MLAVLKKVLLKHDQIGDDISVFPYFFAKVEFFLSLLEIALVHIQRRLVAPETHDSHRFHKHPVLFSLGQDDSEYRISADFLDDAAKLSKT